MKALFKSCIILECIFTSVVPSVLNRSYFIDPDFIASTKSHITSESEIL
jgi:hypothetical protein